MVDNYATWLAQQDQDEEEEALLIGGKYQGQVLGNLHTERRVDHDRSIYSPPSGSGQRRPQLFKPLLQAAEGCVVFGTPLPGGRDGVSWSQQSHTANIT